MQSHSSIKLRSAIPLLSLIALIGGGCADLSSMTPGKMEWVQTHSDAPRAGNAYLVRGFIGLFSHGIDVLTEKVDQSGIRARVFQENQNQLIADEPPGGRLNFILLLLINFKIEIEGLTQSIVRILHT